MPCFVGQNHLALAINVMLKFVLALDKLFSSDNKHSGLSQLILFNARNFSNLKS